MDERLAELACERKEERLLERVLRERSCARTPAGPPSDGPRLRGYELLHGDVAPEEVHAVEQGAPAGELEGVEVVISPKSWFGLVTT